jgi:hypothetical protein
MQPIAARSPGENDLTLAPTATTSPTISWPGTIGNLELPHSPVVMVNIAEENWRV